jgi:hypothetical protein
MSIVQSPTPEGISSEKFHMNISQILSGYEAMYISCCSFNVCAWAGMKMFHRKPAHYYSN